MSSNSIIEFFRRLYWEAQYQWADVGMKLFNTEDHLMKAGRVLNAAVSVQSNKRLSFSVEALNEVVFEGGFGEISIHGEDVEQLRVEIDHLGFGSDQAGARKSLAESSVETSTEAGRLTIRSISPSPNPMPLLSGGFGPQPIRVGNDFLVSGYEVNVDVAVPRHWIAEWDVRADDPEIRMNGLQVRRAELGNDSGPIWVNDVDGPLEISSDSAEVTIIGGRGDVSVTSISGSILVRGRTDYALEAATYTRECALDFLQGFPREATVEGMSVRLALPPEIDAQLELKASLGRILDEGNLLQAASQMSVTEGGKSISATFKQGRNRIVVQATNYDLVLGNAPIDHL